MNKHDPVVSVIIPAYNAEAYIRRSVESALRQGLTDIEVIVIDDSSTDATEAVARAAGDRRLSILRPSGNLGPSGARNLGIAAATGEWIALLDADDFYLPERLERLVQRARELKADLIADNLYICSTEGTIASHRLAFPASRMTNPDAVTAAEFIASDRPRSGLSAAGFMKPLLRRAFLYNNQLQYCEEFGTGEDFDFYVRCLMAGARMFYVPEAFYCYTDRPQSQSRGALRNSPQFISANSRLQRIAQSEGLSTVLAALNDRAIDLANWTAYTSFTDALRQIHPFESFRAFCSLPSRAYAVGELAGAAVRRLKRIAGGASRAAPRG